MNEEGAALDIRKSHPNLYWLVMILAVVNIALGLNFIINQPTFAIFAAPNLLWGLTFLAIGLGKFIALNFYRRLRFVRALMAIAVTYMLFLGLGTMQPFLEGMGSLQLPILYLGIAALQIPLLVEPFINPATKKDDA